MNGTNESCAAGPAFADKPTRPRTIIILCATVALVCGGVNGGHAVDIAAIEGYPSGTVVIIDSSPVITAIASRGGGYTVNGYTYNYWGIFVQDATGALALYGTLPSDTTEPNPAGGDVVNAVGTFSPFHQIPEIGSMSSLTRISGGNSVPTPPVFTIPQLTASGTIPQNQAGYVLQLQNVTIYADSGATIPASGNFPNGDTTYYVKDSGGNIMAMYFWVTSYSADGDMIGTAIPTGPVNITGFVEVYPGLPAEIIPLAFTPAGPSYSIDTISLPPAGGATSGGGAVNGGSNVTVCATPNFGYAFVSWTLNSNVVSTSACYAFIAVSNVTLTADFAPSLNSWINPVSGKWETGSNWSLGTPSIADAADFITNGNTKAVLMDSATATNASALTIGNLTISAAAGETNTLQISMGSPSATLNVLNSLSVGSGGALTISNSALTVGGISNGSFAIDGSVAVLDGSTVTGTNSFSLTVVGRVATGTLSVSGGALQSSSLYLGSGKVSSGVVSLDAGSVACRDRLLVGGNGAGAVWQSGGLLIATNILSAIGFLGPGQLTISNSTMLAGDLTVGCYTQGISTAANTLTVAGGQLAQNGSYTMIGCSGVGQLTVAGTVVLNSLLGVGIDKGTGAVWVVGGQLTVTNGDTFIGCSGLGQLIVSNGTVRANTLYVGNDPFAISDVFYTNAPVSQGVSSGISDGTLTAAGGTVVVRSNLVVGAYVGATGTVWAPGGQIIATNDATAVGYMGIGRMAVSNGTVETLGMFVGQVGDSQGTLTVAGGALISWGDVVVGDCATNATGQIMVDGGDLFVINASHNAVLDLRNGTLTLSSGLLLVDTLIVTNPCAQIVRNGGWLIYDNLVLDPNGDNDGDGLPNGWEQAYGLDPLDPADANVDSDGDGFSNLQEYQAGTDPANSASALRVIDLEPVDDDMLITWTAVGGKRYVLQTATGDSGGFSTDFVDLNPAIVASGTGDTTVTVLHMGVLTNAPARFYRVRLIASP